MKISGRKGQIGAMGPLGMPAPANPPQQAEETAPAGDAVELKSSTQVKTLRQAVDAMPTVRAGKVESLKDAIEEGQYHVESDKLAKRVVDEALSDAILNTRGRG